MPAERPKLMSKEEVDRFWASGEKIAAEVAKWPSWMRGTHGTGGEGSAAATAAPPAAKPGQEASGQAQKKS